jgi:hypothetical protein
MALQFRTAKSWVTKRVTPDYTNQLDLSRKRHSKRPRRWRMLRRNRSNWISAHGSRCRRSKMP